MHKKRIIESNLSRAYSLGLLTACLPSALGQATFTGAQLRGTVIDSSKAAVPRATVIITNDATQVSEKTTTDEQGRYIFNTLTPAAYTLKVEAAGFKTIVRPNIVLRVGQQTDLDFSLEVGEVTTTVEVSAAPPLLNSVSAALGQEVDNRYVTEMPLLDRNVLNLAFLVPGVTEIGDGLCGTSNCTGVNYTSNGQRNSSAEVRMDGAVLGAPEGGVGSGYNLVLYKPSPEIVQEFKLQNNSFSAEYGSNGGTILNIATRSGTNAFHGSGYWFGRRPELNASDFYSNLAGNPKPDFKRDQYGGSIGGPILKQKTFFFFDYDRIRLQSAGPFTTTVPTDAQKSGDFSALLTGNQTLTDCLGHTFDEGQIFNPFSTQACSDGSVVRDPFPGNLIPPSLQDPVAGKIIQLFPQPTDATKEFFNFTKSLTYPSPSWQYDIKIDHNFSEKSRLSGRFSHGNSRSQTGENLYGNPADPNGGTGVNRLNNVALEHTYSINPSTLWTNRFGLDRLYSVARTPDFDPTSVGFTPLLLQGGRTIFPRIDIANYGSLGPNYCVDTVNNHTYPHYASLLTKIIGAHSMKFGGEQRILFTNFWQPCTPGGYFTFDNTPTALEVFNPGGVGNALAAFLIGWPNGNRISLQPGTATKSKETAFFVQDDWKLTNRLTLNLGLRYEWSDPYTERFNRIQIADFEADTGMDIPGLGRLRGVSRFVDSRNRTVSPDRNNFAPRAGLAYRLTPKTVLRAGAGVYYFISPATNNWLTGPAFRADTPILGSLDGGVTRYGSLANPFPKGLIYPQEQKYGLLTMWGLGNGTQMGEEFRNGEIYQWNVGIQRELPGNILLEVVYSGSRSTHLPILYGANRNFVSRADREKWGSQSLYEPVPNPFQSLFVGPDAIFNEPASTYSNPTLPRINLLRPFPQFDGSFTDWPGSGAPWGNARYNSLQVRIEKRFSQGLHFLGSYTFSKMLDDGPGGNSWLGGLAGWSAQDPTNLRGEWSVSPSDTRHRVIWSWGYELPVGRGKRFGRTMNRVLNGAVGGWQVNGIMAFQQGLPLHIGMYGPRLADGSQWPNISGDPLGASIKDVVDGKGIRFNPSAFSDPGDQVPGNSPRYSSVLRGDGIHNLDLSIFKNFRFREDMELQLRAEFFNFTNTPRFGDPDTAFGSPTFGQIFSQSNQPRLGQIGVRFVF